VSILIILFKVLYNIKPRGFFNAIIPGNNNIIVEFLYYYNIVYNNTINTIKLA